MFGSWFKRARFLDADLEDWHLETWAWLMRNRGGMARIEASAIILPIRDFFPPSESVGEARAEHIFDCARRHMGLETWPCQIEAVHGPPPSARVGEFWTLSTGRAANATFQVVNGVGLIRYAGDLLDDPTRLVATFAHELSHLLLYTVRESPPGGHEAEELATDLAVAYRGLGLFSANTAFSFSQYRDSFSQGWSVQASGYFSPRGWAFALALFLALKGVTAEAVRKWLKPEVAGMVKAAERYLAKRPALLQPLREIA